MPKNEPELSVPHSTQFKNVCSYSSISSYASAVYRGTNLH